jgi:predicted permease
MRKHWSVRAFRMLLALYPGEFRDEYGRELALVFADRYRDATSSRERVRVWREAIGGVLREAPREHIQMLTQDLRYAMRMIARSPVFAATAILTLALGIGANTAIFQLIDAVQLRSLPIANPRELAEVRIIGGNGGFGINPGRYSEMTRPLFEELRAHQEAFSGMFAWAAFELRIGERNETRPANGIIVSGDFFRVLGVQPFRGRLIEPQDEASACPYSRVVLSYAYWQRELGGRDLAADPDPRITVGNRRLEIIGVTPPGFSGVAVGETFDVAVPMCRQAQLRRELFDINVMGRLRPGWTIDRASEHLQALSPGLFDVTTPTGYSATSIARYKAFRLGAFSASSGVSVLRREYSTSLRLLLAITGLVLLLACANLANLFIARATTRDREVAVRLALGASRVRLMRQFLTECGVIAVLGAGLAVILAQVLSRLLVRAIASDSSTGGGVTLSLSIDWRLLLFTALVAITTCLIFGSAPALRASRVEPAEAMRTGGRGLTSSRSRFRTQRAMVVMQMAVSLVLLVAALLFVRSFYNLMTFDAGMRQEGITVGFYAFVDSGVKGEQANQFARTMLQEIRATPGIISAGSTTNVPLWGSSWGHGVTVGTTKASAKFTWVSPGYFETMGIPILQGRDFDWHDTTTSRRVAVVNQAFLRRFAEAQANPIGVTLQTSPEPYYPTTVYEIIGVIPDTRYDSLRGQMLPMVFAPDSQFPPLSPWTAVMIHSSTDPASAIATLKQRMAKAHPDLFQDYTVFQTRIREGLLRERLLALLAGFFGALAGVLAMVGLYGMIAFAVAQRRQEIGIRIALGARRPQVIAMVMREAGTLLLTGAAVGTAVSLVAGRSTASLLFGVTAYDPLTLSAALLLLASIAIIASLLPARTAARQDPLVALRSE